MIIGIFLVAIFIVYLFYLLLAERFKKKNNINNMLLGIEISIVGVCVIAISSPHTNDDLFLYIEWIGVCITILGAMIFQRFFRK